MLMVNGAGIRKCHGLCLVILVILCDLDDVMALTAYFPELISYWEQYIYTSVHPAILSSWQPYKTIITDCISLFERHAARTFSDFEIFAKI